MDFSEQNKKVGAMWKVVEKEERQEYDEKARHAKEIHAVDMAAFREKCASFSSACCPSARSQAEALCPPVPARHCRGRDGHAEPGHRLSEEGF